MKPSKKSPQMEESLKNLFCVDRVKDITENRCVGCGYPATEFKDEVSRREYSISGLCQHCQDKIFG